MSGPRPPDEVLAFYALGLEADRLELDHNQLERARALAEALRVLRPHGLLFASAISRFASFLDGLRGSLFDDDAFAGIVEQDLASGVHRNDTGNPRYRSRVARAAARVRARPGERAVAARREPTPPGDRPATLVTRTIRTDRRLPSVRPDRILGA